MKLRPRNPVLQISVLIIAVFILQAYAARQGVMEELFILNAPLVEYPWTILTSVFAHSGLNHLTSNLTALLLFGIPVAWKASKKRFYLFFIGVGSLSAVSQVLVNYYLFQIGFLSEAVGVLGASGAIFGLIGYFISSNKVYRFTGRIMVLPRWARLILYIAVATWITLATASPGAALVGHFAGLLLGLLAGKKNLLRKQRDGL